MRISAEVLDRLLRPAEWRLCIHDPLVVSLRTQKFRKGEGVLERTDGTGELKLPLVRSVFQLFEKEPPEQSGQNAYG